MTLSSNTTSAAAAPPHDTPSRRPWQDVVADKRQAQADAIAAFVSKGYVARDPTIVDEPDISKLAASVARADVRAEDVTIAYITQCIAAHKKVCSFP